MALSTQRAPSSSSPPSSSTTPSTYEVFLSFRGEDTRTGFTNHLYAALNRRGFIVFKDDRKLEQGKFISEELLKAIKESQCAVIVISKNFASSRWCLIELKTIMECRRKTGLIVLPIFYHVNPSEVRKQKRTFAQAFAKHRDETEVDEWIAALTKVGELSGWHVNDSAEEAIVVDQILKRISCQLHLNSIEIFTNLVGMKLQVEELMSLLHLEINDVRIIGIYGMSGIGKSTLAYVLYDTVCREFEGSCFISCLDRDNKSRSVEELQLQIVNDILRESDMKIWNIYYGIRVIAKGLRNKKVFIVLDDVNRDQLKGLAENPNWFGQGSRIIVIGKDCQLWRRIVNETYEVRPLCDDDALHLFCQNAFNQPNPHKSYAVLSKNIMKLAAGHPLALEIIGSSLYGKKIEVWDSAFNVLKEYSNTEILDKLEISYHGLDEFPKQLFLNIVRFFNGMLEREFLPLLKGLGYQIYYFEVLKDRCLIKITKWEKIWVHDLLRKMGQRIMQQESSMELDNGRRLWDHEDNVRILRRDGATKADEGIVVYFHSPKHEQSTSDAFLKATWWTVAILRKTDCLWIRSNWAWLNGLKLCGDRSKLIVTDELRIMELYNSPLKLLLSSWKPHNIVKLNIPYIKFEVLQPRKIFGDLRALHIDGLQDSINMVDYTKIPNLQRLSIWNYRDLGEVHLGDLKQLVKLHLRDCHSLREIHGFNEIPTLQFLSLVNCRDLREVHLGDLKELVELYIEDCNSLREIQDFNEIPTLQFLSLVNCSDLREVHLGDLKKLVKLRIRDCNSLREIQGFNEIPNLQFLSIRNCRDLREVHLGDLKELVTLDMQVCNSLDETSFKYLSHLFKLTNLNLCDNKFMTLPDDICLLSKLKDLRLYNCSKLRTLPKLPSSLSLIDARDCPLLEMGCCQADMRVPHLCNGVWYSVTTNTSYYDGTPYKILQLNPRHLLIRPQMHCVSRRDESAEDTPWFSHRRLFCYCYRGGMFVWGPTLGFEMPEWFNHRSIICLEKIQCCVDVDSAELILGFALFVAYEVYGNENSNRSISGDSNLTFPEFTWQLEASDTHQELSVVFHTPEVPRVGPNGFWAFIPARLFMTKMSVIEKCHSFETLIGTSNSDVKVTKYGARLVHKDSVSEFFNILGRVTPPGLELKDLKDFYFEVWTDEGTVFS